MAIYRVSIDWRGVEADFLTNNYSRSHQWHFDGGISVQASSSPLVVPVPMSNEKAIDPEEAFIAAISSCHMLWFLDYARKANFVVKSYQDEACGTMKANDEKKIAITEVTLNPNIVYTGVIPDRQALQTLHDKAHHSCFIANSVKTKININLDHE